MATTPTTTTTTPPSTPVIHGPLNIDYLNGNLLIIFFIDKNTHSIDKSRVKLKIKALF